MRVNRRYRGRSRNVAFSPLHAEDRWPDGTLDTIEVETLSRLSGSGTMMRIRVPRSVAAGLGGNGNAAKTFARKVDAIEPCPPIAGGPGKVVLTTVNHLNRYVFAMQLTDPAGRNEMVRATGFHKFYSADRKQWVWVEDLHSGEHVPGFAGLLTITSVERTPGVQRVYNMTVESDHVYHVATLGALVHNDTCGPGGRRTPAQNRQAQNKPEQQGESKNGMGRAGGT